MTALEEMDPPKWPTANADDTLESTINNSISDTSTMIDQLAIFLNRTAAYYHDVYSLQNKMIDGLETTLEQAFFYYAASEFCSQTVQEKKRVEFRIRIVVSWNLSLERVYSKWRDGY